MRRVAIAVMCVIALAAPAQANQKHETRRERLVQRALERDEWGRTDRVVRISIIVARHLVNKRGWGHGEFLCLKKLWSGESGWRWWIPGGIPQAMPMDKMRSAGGDYRSNPVTQIRWGLGYIGERYGKPSGTGCSPPY